MGPYESCDLLPGISLRVPRDPIGGYAGNDAGLKNFPAITHVGCILQARRKFLETSKATKKVGSAEEEIGDIRKLCAIEAVLREKLGIERISGTRFQILRSERCTPILEISTA